MQADATGTGYTITQAASFLRVHTNTLRKRIRTGKLRATLVDGPTGQEYRIPVEEIRVLAEASRAASLGGSQTPYQHGDAGVVDTGPVRSLDEGDTRETPPVGGATHRSDSTAPGPVGAAIQSAARAREMAAYTEELLGPWRRRIEEQAEEIGGLRAELRQAQSAAQEALSAAEQRAVEQARAAEETGRLKAELTQATERLAEFEAATDALERAQETAAAEASRRPWWRFWG